MCEFNRDKRRVNHVQFAATGFKLFYPLIAFIKSWEKTKLIHKNNQLLTGWCESEFHGNVSQEIFMLKH